MRGAGYAARAVGGVLKCFVLSARAFTMAGLGGTDCFILRSRVSPNRLTPYIRSHDIG
jgi:hypothetical protein